MICPPSALGRTRENAPVWRINLRQASLDVSALIKAAETPAEKVAIAAASSDWSTPALWVFVVSYVVFAATTWLVYLRRSSGYVQDEKTFSPAAAVSST